MVKTPWQQADRTAAGSIVWCQVDDFSSLISAFLAGSKSLRTGSTCCCCLGPQIANMITPSKLSVQSTITQQIFVVLSKSDRFKK